MEIITKSAAQTQKLGRSIGSSLKGGDVVFLTGELGAGKTTFVQGLAKGVGVDKAITSPTFIIMREYEIPAVKGMFYHVDLYRFEKEVESEMKNLGIFDLWGKEGNIFVVEWADRISQLPAFYIQIKISKGQKDSERIFDIQRQC